MPSTVAIVEGHGDVDSFPILAGKIAGWLGEPCYLSKPIRGGEWRKLRRAGELEKLVDLACTRDGVQRVLFVVDLDDDCPIEEKQKVESRRVALSQRYGVDIQICFSMREFEAWILNDLESVSAACRDYDWTKKHAVDDPQTLRDAKGPLRQMLGAYSETVDQPALTKGINPKALYEKDRSFRKFVKDLSGLDYEALQAAL